MDKVKIGAIGVGGMAGGHLRNLSGFDDVEFAAMCDISEERANKASQDYGGTPYTDYKEMYDKEELDAVYICTPPFAHGEQELIACEKGIPFFIEKPVGTRADVAREIHEAVLSSGNITSVGYHWRYHGHTREAKAALEGASVVGALGYWMGGLPRVPWWRVRAESGGQHVEQTTHIFDLCRYLVGGDVVAVHGFAAQGSMTDVPNYDVDDMSVVNLQFANGAVANITSACMLQGWGRVKLEVLCRGLVVEVNSGDAAVNRDGESESIGNDTNGGVREDRVFIDAVKSGDSSEILAPYAEGLKTLEVSLAASESFAQRKQINL